MQIHAAYRFVLFMLIFVICSNSYAEEPLRIALTGSSITWGDGLLSDSFVGEIELYLRTQMAKTILSEEMSYTKPASELSNPKLFGGKASKITGPGNSVSFSLTSKSLSIVQAIERSPNSATVIDLFVDGDLYDTFTNYNPSPLGSELKEFVGDGSTVKFDLGRCFTYAHQVTIDGLSQRGSLNTAGYGANFPLGNDYLIIRKYIQAPRLEEVAVHHVLLFKTPPAKGAKIIVAYHYGENICYAKTTVGELGYGLATGLESRYGDDNLNFAPTVGSSLSSGLDFRYTDERAIKSWEFQDVRERYFEFRIRDLDKSVNQAGTPYFIINFATDRMHRIMNAGIGGWTAEKLATDLGLRNLRELMRFEPELIIFESGTNDDWSKGEFVCTRKLAGLSEAQVKKHPSLWLKALNYLGNDKYAIETCELSISKVEENSITFSSEGVDFGEIRAGDILVIGDYHGDERSIQCRLIESWDPERYKAQFREPLELAPHFGLEKLENFVGQKVRVKRVDDFLFWFQNCIEAMRAFNPNVAIGIVDTGLCNYYTRTLLGYPQKLKEFCKGNELVHVDSYEALKTWQYSQLRNITAYLGPGGSNLACGQEEYLLTDYRDQDIHLATGSSLLRNWSVKVNGEEVYGKDCYVEGGQIMGIPDNQSGYELEFNNWQFPRVYKFIPTRLVFSRNVPQAESIIEIKSTSIKWSGDDTHPNSMGAEVYGKVIVDNLPQLLGKRKTKFEFTEAIAKVDDYKLKFKLYKEQDALRGTFSFPGSAGLYGLKAFLEQENQGKLRLLTGGRELEVLLPDGASELEFNEHIFLSPNELITLYARGIMLNELLFFLKEQTITQKPIHWEESPIVTRSEKVILIQAEDYVRQGGGRCSFLTTHKPRFGSGIMDWGLPGHWLEWEVEIPCDGIYTISLGAATTYPRVIRALTVDGVYPQSQLGYLEFTDTGGWGRSLEQWGNYLLHDQESAPIEIKLAAGTHRLRLTSVYSWLNLDYLALCKVD
jgi:hypothetical protein